MTVDGRRFLDKKSRDKTVVHYSSVGDIVGWYTRRRAIDSETDDDIITRRDR